MTTETKPDSLNILQASFKQTGKSRKTDEFGMLEMQARAYKERDSQYLLIKSPPASGKSRALMFLALDKLHNQGLNKVIVAVPEMSIGSSFKSTDLKSHGFYENWQVDPKYNLCVAGGDAGKVNTFISFLGDASAKVLLCTHATLRFAYERLLPGDFDGVLLGIDEFHHASASEENKLGALLDAVMDHSTAHIVAMTGSYFRGDAVPIMTPEHESQFRQVTYSYYEQLNGYSHLKSLGINYHFYSQGYLKALDQVLDTTKKTIIHIPNVNSFESTKDKYAELDHILDHIGTVTHKDEDTGILTVVSATGQHLKIADLVTDDKGRANVQKYLSEVTEKDELDIIIALGMAKEGFDWIWCEHVLTIGYRSSLTEIIQIIGRATRDAPGKTHAQFTNLISQPDAKNEDVDKSVNNLLKAITISLLMQDVLSPNINFKPRSRMTHFDFADRNTIAVDDSSAPMSDAATQALANLDNIKAALMQRDKESVAPVMSGQQDLQTFIEFELPKIINGIHPGLDEDELHQVAQALHKSLVVQATGGIYSADELPENAPMWEDADLDLGEGEGAASVGMGDGKPSIDFSDNNKDKEEVEPTIPGGTREARDPATRKFALIDNKFIDVDKLHFDLIQERIENTNPFEASYSVLSKSITTHALKSLESHIAASRSSMTTDEATLLWPHAQEFMRKHGRNPQLTTLDHLENRLALAVSLMKQRARELMAKRSMQ